MIAQAFIISMMVLSLWYTMQEGEIFGKLGDLLAKTFTAKIHPALFECNVCMTPWYGSAIYWLFPWHEVSLPLSSFVCWIVVIFVAMGFQIVINKFQQKEEQKIIISGTERTIISQAMEEFPKQETVFEEKDGKFTEVKPNKDEGINY